MAAAGFERVAVPRTFRPFVTGVVDSAKAATRTSPSIFVDNQKCKFRLTVGFGDRCESPRAGTGSDHHRYRGRNPQQPGRHRSRIGGSGCARAGRPRGRNCALRDLHGHREAVLVRQDAARSRAWAIRWSPATRRSGEVVEAAAGSQLRTGRPGLRAGRELLRPGARAVRRRGQAARHPSRPRAEGGCGARPPTRR